jgi:hypothetical protein
MPQMLEEFEFPKCSFSKHWSAKRLHDLLHGNGLSCDLIFGGAVEALDFGDKDGEYLIYQTRPKAPMPTGWSSVYLIRHAS